jgi:chorismate mutase / prephenate dehydratase
MKVLGSYPSRDITKTSVAPSVLVTSEKASKPSDAVTTESAPPAEKPKKKKSYPLSSRDHKPEDTIIDVKGVKIGGPQFVVMAGPCSVESKNQIMSCARHAKENGAVVLRGGCFKPRTSPYSFQGMGYEGLDLLAEAGRLYGLPIITEVMSPEDVDGIAAKADILQIGARNMQNFTLLKAVGRAHLPVMLKRGLSSSLDDLLNAAEYILAHGNQQVILCERGIRTFETATRSTLDISAVPVLKRETHLPIIIDPSHAAGERDLVPPLARAAKAVGAHGIIVEFHPEPEKALSDGPQALRFPQFEEMMGDLLGR